MNCDKIKLLLCDFGDDRLDAGTAWHVQTHLAECAACARINRDMQEVRGLLQALPTQKTSAHFEARLAERIALTRRPERPQSGAGRLRGWFGPSSRSLLRPALGLGAAAASLAGVVFFAQPAPVDHIVIPVVSDSSLVSHCLQQHRNDVASQPLSDWAAQDLAGHLDSAPSATPEAAALPSEDNDL